MIATQVLCVQIAYNEQRGIWYVAELIWKYVGQKPQHVYVVTKLKHK